MDKHSIGPEFFDDKIKKALTESKCVVILVTKDCFKAKDIAEKDWFLEEIKTALALDKKIIPVLFDKIESLSETSILDELNKNFNHNEVDKIVKSQSIQYSIDYPEASIKKLVSFIDKANENKNVLA